MQSFTFGVELEMVVALVLDGQEHPNPSETRIVVFPPLNGASDFSNNKSIGKFNNFQIPPIYYLDRIAGQFSRIIAEHTGFPLAGSSLDSTGWAIVGDSSCHHPPLYGDVMNTEGYDWCGVELKTPALSFTPESLQAVVDVCNLIQKHFKVLVNNTCGLHVHIGHGKSNFSTEHLAKIMAFLYAFEPQISTLHPASRYSHGYGKAMRNSCNYSTTFHGIYGERAPLSLAVATILSATRRKDRALRRKLGDLVTTRGYGKNGNYNFDGIYDLSFDNPKPTIEFRQHEGTINGEEITQWVRVLVGMLSYIEKEEFVLFVNLLRHASTIEKWEKLGDGKDVAREIEMGPISADEGLTIVQLLRHIGLDQQADYYEDKLHKHDEIPDAYMNPPTEDTGGYKWEYQNVRRAASVSSEEYQSDHRLRQIFDKCRIARVASRLAGEDWDFDEDDPMWPAHAKVVDFLEESEESADSDSSGGYAAEIRENAKWGEDGGQRESPSPRNRI